MRHTFHLTEPLQSHKLLTQVLWPEVKAWLICGGGSLTLKVSPATRKESHNRRFHALIGHISDALKGDLADKEDAKRILISAFRIDTIKDPNLAEEWRQFGDYRMGRGLRGEVVMLGMQSREFSVKLGGAFVVWLEAFVVEHEIAIPAPKWMEE